MPCHALAWHVLMAQHTAGCCFYCPALRTRPQAQLTLPAPLPSTRSAGQQQQQQGGSAGEGRAPDAESRKRLAGLLDQAHVVLSAGVKHTSTHAKARWRTAILALVQVRGRWCGRGWGAMGGAPGAHGQGASRSV